MILTDNDSIDNYREVTPAERAAIEAADAAWVRPPQALIDEWNELCVFRNSFGKVTEQFGFFNEATGYAELNGITGIGIEEMKYIYLARIAEHDYATARTNIPSRGLGNKMIYLDAERFTNTSLEIIKEYYIDGTVNSDRNGGNGCQILNSNSIREVSFVRIADATNRLLIQSTSLEYIGFSAQNANAKKFSYFEIKNASKFRLDGMEQVVKWVRDCTATVHPDVYAKLTGDTTNAAAAALSAEELAQWQGLMTAAENKNLLFATV